MHELADLALERLRKDAAGAYAYAPEDLQAIIVAAHRYTTAEALFEACIDLARLGATLMGQSNGAAGRVLLTEVIGALAARLEALDADIGYREQARRLAQLASTDSGGASAAGSAMNKPRSTQGVGLRRR